VIVRERQFGGRGVFCLAMVHSSGDRCDEV
jgi:hypothetical protein